ncbi:MAG: hypothetical protein KAT40_00930 [Bacteroidales bacterium]|nr:hypothetical protein [Bacteroidales bacterium]
MKKLTKTDLNFNTTNLLLFMYSKRKPLFIVSIFALIVSVLVSLLITPRFRSTVILFPASSTSVSKALISTSSIYEEKGILQFGEEEETERLLQILYSDEIKDFLVVKYDLFNHYEIDPGSKYRYTQLSNRMKENISFRKTEYMSIEIEVLDTDPMIAAGMGNDIVAMLDSTISRMRKRRAVEAYQIVKKEYFVLQKEIKELEDSLRQIGEQGVYDYESQSTGLNEAYLKAVSEGNTFLTNKLEEQIKKLGKYGGTYLFLKEFLENESTRLSDLKEKYVRAKVDLEQNLPHTFIVNEAKVAEKKAYPRRTLIVITSTMSAFLLTLLLLIAAESVLREQP